MQDKLKKVIADVPDFPKPGILFKDITPILLQPTLVQETVSALAGPFANDGIQKVVGIESRGFIFGPSLALALNAGFVLARKPGKLPRETVSETYALEYGEDSLEIHREDLSAGEKVLVVDDLLATGGTASAVLRLVRRLEAQVVGLAFVIELEFLKGREKLSGARIHSLVRY